MIGDPIQFVRNWLISNGSAIGAEGSFIVSCNSCSPVAAGNSASLGATSPARVLLPVVQLVVRVGNGDGRLFQVADSASDVAWLHGIPRVVVE